MEKSSRLNDREIRNFLGSSEDVRTQIEERIHEILLYIASKLHTTIKWWYVYGADEGEVGEIKNIIDMQNVRIAELVIEPPLRTLNVTIDNNTFDVASKFPTHWLYRPYEKEIDEGITRNLYAASIARDKKAKMKLAKKQREEQTIESIFQKVDANEIKFLKKKLKIK